MSAETTSSDEPISVNIRELLGEEKLAAELKNYVLSGLAQHYAVYSGFTAMKLQLRTLCKDHASLCEAAKIVSQEWRKEALRARGPDFQNKKAMVEAQLSRVLKEGDLDNIFESALDEMAKDIEGSLTDEGDPLSVLLKG
jgi:hypothetical protein